MKLHWFIRRGILFLPTSLMGWSIFTALAVYAVYIFIEIDGRSHSASDTLINWAFCMLVAGLVYSLIGFFTEKK